MHNIVQKGLMGLELRRHLVCIGLLFTAFSALRQIFIAPSNIQGEMEFQIEFFLWIGTVAYLVGPYGAIASELITNVRDLFTQQAVIDKVALDCRHQARRAVPIKERSSPKEPHFGIGSLNELQDRSGHERWRFGRDQDIIDCVLADGVAHNIAKVLEVMHACIRLGRGDAAVKLFDQMLEMGVTPDMQRISKAVSCKFFKLVATTLDDERVQEDGLRFLDLNRALGIAPSPIAQNRVLEAWKMRKLIPQSVLTYFLEMRSAGVSLSPWAYRYVVTAHERSDPEFALEIHREMEGSGIKLDRQSFNAVLGACTQLGMYDKARELFMQMAERGLSPNAKTYCIMVKAYSFNNQHEESIVLFETMRELCFKPDSHAYHHVIRSCITLQRIEYAVELYNDMVQAKVSGACIKSGRNSLATELTTELARMKRLAEPHQE